MKNIKRYIESGVLEIYVLGLSTNKENKEVMQMAMLYPEIKKEIETICTALQVYINFYTLYPSPEIKSSVLKLIKSFH